MQFILRETLNFEFHSSGNFSFSSYYMLVLLWLFITHLLLGSISLFLFHHLSQILITTYPAASNSSHFCLLSVSYPSVVCSQPSQNNLQSLCAAFHLLSPLRFPHWLLEMAAGYIRPEPSCAVPESAMPGQLFCSVWHTWLGWDLYNNPTLKSPSRSFCFSSSISQQLNCEPVTEPLLNCH